MAYTLQTAESGVLPIGSTDSGIISPYNANTGSTTTIPTPPLRPGMIIRGQDPTYGEAEFILLAGVASTAVGSVVSYNTSSFTTSLSYAGANIPGPIAVATAANTAATTWAWYQISGVAVAKKTSSVSLDASAAVGFTTGGTFAASATGSEVQGALVAATSTAAATTVQVMINRPHMQGRIT